jgi:hypothetical protein
MRDRSRRAARLRPALPCAAVAVALLLGGCPPVRPPAGGQIDPDPRFADVAVPKPFSHDDLQMILRRFLSVETDELTEEHVVEYVSLKWADGPLRRYLAMAAKVAPGEADDEYFPDANHRLAYWINVYNAAVLAAVCRHYPIDGPADVGGLFSGVRFTIGGRWRTLDQIEDAMRRQFPSQWRAGFALCRATRGSPPLRLAVYDPQSLTDQLDAQFRVFLPTDDALRVDAERKALVLSPVFRRYAEPMRHEARRAWKLSEPSLLDAVRLHADATVSYRIALASGYRVRFEAEEALNDRDYEKLLWRRIDGR